MMRTLTAMLVALLTSAPAWADHGGGLGNSRMSPIVTALLWAGAAFLVGLSVVAIVTVLTRRRPAEPPDS